MIFLLRKGLILMSYFLSITLVVAAKCRTMKRDIAQKIAID